MFRRCLVLSRESQRRVRACKRGRQAGRASERERAKENEKEREREGEGGEHSEAARKFSGAGILARGRGLAERERVQGHKDQGSPVARAVGHAEQQAAHFAPGTHPLPHRLIPARSSCLQ